MISTRSPERSGRFSFAWRPFTLARAHVLPTREWIAYAKSRGVPPRGKRMVFPLGVRQKTLRAVVEGSEEQVPDLEFEQQWAASQVDEFEQAWEDQAGN